MSDTSRWKHKEEKLTRRHRDHGEIRRQELLSFSVFFVPPCETILWCEDMGNDRATSPSELRSSKQTG